MVSVRRVVPILLLVIATGAFAQKSSQPPRELHRVGEHWTAYYPPDPATYPAGAKTHEIKSGDTLWALAQQYFGNPYLWPQLWESNTWITDAHWIYPGDVLLVESEAIASGETATESEVVAAETGGEPVARVAPEGRPLPLGTESDIYCYGYIGDPNEPLPNFIESFEDNEVKYIPRATIDASAAAAAGDLIYINGGTSTGLVAGETYLAVEPGELVLHPVTGEVIGRHYAYTGQIRILCADAEQSRAIITESCREMAVGARLKPVPQLPIPIARIPEMAAWCDPSSGRATGYIVDSREWELGLVEGNLVQINLGRDNQIQPGDFLTVYRPTVREGQPPAILGQIGVLTTEARTATAIILSARREILVGDAVELR